MVDLLEFHKEHQSSEEEEFASACGDSVQEFTTEAAGQKSTYAGFLDMVRSLSAPLRNSLEAIERRISLERPRTVDLQDTAHDDLGHTPLPAMSTGNQQEGPASVVSQSSLYKPSKDHSDPPQHQQLAEKQQTLSTSQQLSQAGVFSTWQEEHSICA